MITIKEKVEAKLLALTKIYAKDINRRQAYLEKLTYIPEEMTAVLNRVSDPKFRDWILFSIPLMQTVKT
jgi:hypothetical protein